ncbi:RNA-binding protein 39-like isoform 1 [Planoprotostelium fungivorum]|uniref:RNA-binding protein 39-like isoform 1 n=1 Tax=Planoprotostelium fungivorum TaxID=1890364 RepID=A0A2P6MYA0_9EUKA|nr:RNA-binding protein 39-like isoform 2 [Planoprotostelium fungivorum]PRP76680.1 RNA-binding protein 39-like isoform 1 [Planoprotostelium fungivorum]
MVAHACPPSTFMRQLSRVRACASDVNVDTKCETQRGKEKRVDMDGFDIEALLEARMKGQDVSELVVAAPAPNQPSTGNLAPPAAEVEEKSSEKNGREEHKEESDRRKRHRSDSPGRESRSSRHRNRSDRDRDRSGDRDHSRDRDDRRDRRDRDRDRHDRDRDRSDRRDRDRDRDRSDRDRRDRDRDDRRRDMSPESERKDREKRARDRDREDQRRKEAAMTPQEREAMELDRDARTIFAINLPTRADEDDIIKHFSKAGDVRDVRLITDRNSRRSKGFAYVEFFDQTSVPAGLKMSNSIMMGHAIQVQQTFVEKSRMQTVSAVVQPTRIYVGALHLDITEDDLKNVFAPFGDIEFVNLHVEPDTGKSKGFAFIQFRKPEDAKRAMNTMNGYEIAGRTIKVGLVQETPRTTHSEPVHNPGGRALSHAAGPGTSFHSSNDRLDDEEDGIQLNAHSRASLMAKLQRGGSNVLEAPQTVSYSGPCVLLKNMFDPSEETEPNWDEEVKQDVKEECSRFGSIIHIHVDRESKGFVYIKFGSTPAAANAIKALDGRWFSKRQIQANYFNERRYHELFKDAVTF